MGDRNKKKNYSKGIKVFIKAKDHFLKELWVLNVLLLNTAPKCAKLSKKDLSSNPSSSPLLC